MNKFQRLVLALAVIVIIAMCLYPPWRIETGKQPSWKTYTPSNIVSGGYSLLFAPPYNATGVDVGRLSIQCIIILALTGTALVVFGQRRPND